MLCLEVELLTGVYRAALPDGSSAEWPPHPERVFSALVQALGDGGSDPVERSALEWLERQEPPSIEADLPDHACVRDTPIVYVPPNDQAGVWINRFPERRRQARGFRAVVPQHPIVRFFWSLPPAHDEGMALDQIASRLAAIGHSASLVRAHFRNDLTPDGTRLWRPHHTGDTSVRIPHRGRLSRLEDWLRNARRPQGGATQRYRSPGAPEPLVPPESWFGGPGDWFVFEDDDGPFRPDILGFAHVAQRVRHALMQLGPQPVPNVISGHRPDGGPILNPHLAIVPLQNVGWPYSDGGLLGFALIFPRGLGRDERTSALRAVAAFARVDQGEQSSIVQLTTHDAWEVVRAATPARASLRPNRWCSSARTWASVTPVLLDRFPGKGDPTEEAAIVAAACRNIGLPEPEEIEIHKNSAIRGAETTYPARGRPSRPDWSFPGATKFAARPRRHVVLQFAAPVTGPVILGAGRFAGFGMCLPVMSPRIL